MASLDELRSVRIQKLEALQQYGERPYNVVSEQTHSISDIISNFELLLESKQTVTVSGRIMSIRGQGAILFVQIWDGTDQVQAVFQRDYIDAMRFSLFVDCIDVGDFVDCTGSLFITQRGQDSVQVSDWKCLTKSLLPLPDKWRGLQDDDERYRKRYLEMISDHSVFDRFIVRSRVIRYVRNFFDTLGFVEVETPILQSQAGGAMARTFDTFHEDLQIPMVLRIALELDHKILMAGGLPAVYEIGKNFRNEGSDPTHIQEFTMIEWYWAYHTLEDNIRITEQLLKGIVQDVCGGAQDFTVYDKNGDAQTVSFDGEWGRVRFNELLQQYAGLDCSTATLDDIQKTAQRYGMSETEVTTTGRGNLLDFIFKKSARHQIINPTFVTHYPGDLKPLAQQNPDGTASIAQLIIAGAEITNQYAELIDPMLQRKLLESQSLARADGDAEAMQIDERFLTAMEHGMPPMTGFGMGIDRLVAILTSQRNLRETIFFPIMRPEDAVSERKKDTTTQIAVVVINVGAGLEMWQVMNTVAHVTAGYIGRTDKKIFWNNTIETANGNSINLNVSHAIMIKQGADSDQLRQLVERARSAGLEVSEFTREMLDTTNDRRVSEITKTKALRDIEFLGVGIFGEKSLVDELTGGLGLYS